MRNQLAAMADECREFTTGFNQTRMICAKPGGHVESGDEYHHDPFHNVRWREVSVENTPAEVATRVAAHSTCECGGETVPTQSAGFDDQIELPVLERRVLPPLTSGVVYVRPLRRQPVLTRLGGLLAGVLFA